MVIEVVSQAFLHSTHVHHFFLYVHHSCHFLKSLHLGVGEGDGNRQRRLSLGTRGDFKGRSTGNAAACAERPRKAGLAMEPALVLSHVKHLKI
jgi:hypothetical protein